MSQHPLQLSRATYQRQWNPVGVMRPPHSLCPPTELGILQETKGRHSPAWKDLDPRSPHVTLSIPEEIVCLRSCCKITVCVLQQLALFCLIKDSALPWRIPLQVPQGQDSIMHNALALPGCRLREAEGMSVLSNNYWLLVLSTSVLVLYDPCLVKHRPWSSMASPQSMLEMQILRPHAHPTASQSGFSQASPSI